jgi:hypothetical protein
LPFATVRYAVGIVGLLAELGSNLRILGHIRGTLHTCKNKVTQRLLQPLLLNASALC